MMKAMKLFCCFGLFLVSSAASGADAEAGKRLAQLQCAPCHIVAPNQRQELAEAPPFEVIGRKFEFNFDMLVLGLMGPHAKMNFSLRRPEAVDIAAYIGTLAR
jgi:mono/diheme cytochrome c family protein